MLEARLGTLLMFAERWCEASPERFDGMSVVALDLEDAAAAPCDILTRERK